MMRDSILLISILAGFVAGIISFLVIEWMSGARRFPRFNMVLDQFGIALIGACIGFLVCDLFQPIWAALIGMLIGMAVGFIIDSYFICHKG